MHKFYVRTGGTQLTLENHLVPEIRSRYQATRALWSLPTYQIRVLSQMSVMTRFQQFFIEHCVFAQRNIIPAKTEITAP